MLNSIRQTSKDSLLYGLGNIAVKIVGFLLIPLYTDPKYFSVEDFGIIAILDISGLLLVSLMASGLPQSLMRWYWDKNYVSDQKGIFFMSLSVQILISLLFCLVLYPFTQQFSNLLFNTIDWSKTLKLMILSSALQAINNIINTLMRVQSRSVLYTIINISKLFGVLLLTIWLIVFREAGVNGIYLAQVAGNLTFILILSGYAIRNSSFYMNLPVLRSMSRFGFPLLLANFATASLAVIDRYSLNSLTLLKYVAIYTIAFKISSVLKIVIVDSVRMAVLPVIMRKMDSPNNKRFFSKTFLYSSYILMLGVIAVSLFSYEIIKAISRSTEFWNAYLIVPVLSLSVFFINLRDTSVYGLIIKKKTGIIGLNVVTAIIINIVLNIILIPKWNIAGAALATLSTQLICWFIIYYKSQKEYYIPFELGKVAMILFWGIIISFSGILMTEIDLLPRLIIKTACLISFPFILYLFNFYEPVEILAIKGFVAKWRDLRKFRKNLNSLKHIPDDL